MLMILRAVFIFIVLFACSYGLIHLAVMTPYFNKYRNKRILRRVLFACVALSATVVVFITILTILN